MKVFAIEVNILWFVSYK